jgi:hypothetical protein
MLRLFLSKKRRSLPDYFRQASIQASFSYIFGARFHSAFIRRPNTIGDGSRK